MELRHFRYFVAVAEEENVTRAAVRLHVSQPSLSRQIRDLESDLDVALFEHGPRSVRLTEAGRVLLVEAKAVLSRVDEAVEATKASAGGKEGAIQVGFAPSLTVEMLPEALRRFHETNPRVKVQLHDLSTQEMIEGLKEKRLHVGLMIKAPEKAMKGLKFVELQRFAVCVTVHPSHPLATAKTVGLKDIVTERLVAYDRINYPEYQSWLAKLFSRFSSTPVIAEEHDGSTSLIAAVEAGRGVALVQQGFERFVGPRLKVRPLQPPPAPFVLGAAWREGMDSAAAREFIVSGVGAPL